MVQEKYAKYYHLLTNFSKIDNWDKISGAPGPYMGIILHPAGLYICIYYNCDKIKGAAWLYISHIHLHKMAAVFRQR